MPTVVFAQGHTDRNDFESYCLCFYAITLYGLEQISELLSFDNVEMTQ